ncbi:unnamed protein product, partial [Porites lobata]
IRSHICLPIFKERRANGKGKTKKLVENVFTTYLEDRREQRETTYIYRTLIRYMKIQQYSVPRRCLRSSCSQNQQSRTMNVKYCLWNLFSSSAQSIQK